MSSLRVGVIGLGVGEKHVRTYLKNPECRVVTLCDFSDEKLQWAKKEFPGINLVSSADDMIAEPDIDVVSIASFDDDHAKQVIRSLQSGKHVFVEKPICQTMEELITIKKVWDSKRNIPQYLACNLILREAPLYRWLREEIRNGTFGTIYSFDAEYLYGRLHKITDGWRNSIHNYSVMEGGGIHMIDLMLWLTNERPVSVFSAANRICSKGTKFRYNDFETSILSFKSGMIGRITANFGCVHRHQHVVRIYGTKATFLYDDAGPRLYASRDPSDPGKRIDHSPLPESKGDLIPGFISAIMTKKDITDETQIIFDGICISTACDRAVITQEHEMIEYL